MLVCRELTLETLVLVVIYDKFITNGLLIDLPEGKKNCK